MLPLVVWYLALASLGQVDSGRGSLKVVVEV